MDEGWRLLADLPDVELTRLGDVQIARHIAPLRARADAGAATAVAVAAGTAGAA
jgi:hypothetical protein